MAMSDELDAWLRTAPKNELRASPQGGEIVLVEEQTAVGKLRHSLEDACELRFRTERLRDEHASVLARLMGNIAHMEHLLRDAKTITGQQLRAKA
jgi:hypothetical protein